MDACLSAMSATRHTIELRGHHVVIQRMTKTKGFEDIRERIWVFSAKKCELLWDNERLIVKHYERIEGKMVLVGATEIVLESAEESQMMQDFLNDAFENINA